MTLFAQAEPSIWLSVVIAAVLWGFGVVWITVGVCLWRGKPVLPRQPRRPVPWKGIDLLAVLIVWQVLEMLAAGLVFGFLGSPVGDASKAAATNEHPIALLMASGNVWLLLVSGISALLVAPIFEEFIFRVLFQGWLESAFGRLRWVVGGIGRWSVVAPVLVSSLLFSMIHHREAVPPLNVWVLAWVFLVVSAVRVTIMILAIVFLRFARGASAVDFGWSPSRCFSDFGLGVLAFAASALPIFAILVGLKTLFPGSPLNDPLALLPLAVALGIVYYRTHRIVPVIALHMSLNFTSLTVAWLSLP